MATDRLGTDLVNCGPSDRAGDVCGCVRSMMMRAAGWCGSCAVIVGRW
jgi:hypothetical protein